MICKHYISTGTTQNNNQWANCSLPICTCKKELKEENMKDT